MRITRGIPSVFACLAIIFIIAVKSEHDGASTTSPSAHKQNCCNNDDPLPDIQAIQRLDVVERIPCSISREDFRNRYEFPRRPVVLIGCDETWPARDTWTFDKLAVRFSSSSRWKATFDHMQQVWEKTHWHKIKEAIQNNTFFYIFDQLRDPEASTLENDYQVPGPFQDVDMYATLHDFPEGYGRRRWFVMGSKNSGTDPHMDPSATDAWNTAIHGYKWWILFPSSVDEADVMCDKSCSAPNLTTRHWYATVGVESAEVEYDGGERAVHLLQKPGETLYLPYGRVHSVYNMEDCVGITENYGSPADVTALWQSLVAEGTVGHRRQFYFHILDDDQRRTIRESSFFHPSQVGLHAVILTLLEGGGAVGVVLLLCFVAIALILINSHMGKTDDRIIVEKKIIQRKRTVLVRKSAKQQKKD